MKSNDTDIDHFLEDFLKTIFTLIKDIVLDLGKGLKKLNKSTTLLPFLILLFLSFLLFFLRENFMLLPLFENVNKQLFFLLFLIPLFYLILIGGSANKEAEKYNQIFKSINFKSRNGKFPFFCHKRIEGKKQYLTFKSTIPLSEWKKCKEYLESGFDCNILKIHTTSSKNLITLTTVPASCVIPTFIRWKDEYRSAHHGGVVLGVSSLSKITFDLNRTPHVLFAGETGSGKSVLLRNCLWQMIYQSSRVIMMDFKGGVEFGKQYERYGEVITKRERALEVLDILLVENTARLTLFRDLEVKNLPEYNKKTGQNLCRICLFCDELAELLDKKGASKNDKALLEKIEGRISSLARLSRATGINLFFGIQRPDANVLTGQIKNNIPVRVSGRFADKAASEIVLGTTDATDLPDVKGRFLFKLGNEVTEFQSYFFEDDVLKDLNIKMGSMLTGGLEDISSYQQEKESKYCTYSSPHTQNKNCPESKAYKDWEGTLQEMDEYDLNLNFDV